MLLAAAPTSIACRPGGGAATTVVSSEQPGGATGLRVRHAPPLAAGKAPPLVRDLQRALRANWRALRRVGPASGRLHYLAYTALTEHDFGLEAAAGTITRQDERAARRLGVDLRLGSPGWDHTELHAAGGGYGKPPKRYLPLGDDPEAIFVVAREATRAAYARAKKAWRQVSEALGKRPPLPGAASFAPARAERRIAPPAGRVTAAAAARWRRRLRRLSAAFGDLGDAFSSHVDFRIERITRTMVSSEGAVLQVPRTVAWICLVTKTRAPDAMPLKERLCFHAARPEGLPSERALIARVRALTARIQARRRAPLAQPYRGPAIFRAPAAGVLIHEALGHPLEGRVHDAMAATAAYPWRPGRRILPPFVSVFDDPRLTHINGRYLNGGYPVDDEGVSARRVDLVRRGVLRDVLAARRPTFVRRSSNGHGRRAPWRFAAARQSNLVLVGHRPVTYAELRRRLRRELVQRGLPYGLIIGDARKGRFKPRRLILTATWVHQMFADGRPDRLVRGIDALGTHILLMRGIQATASDYATFNGTCTSYSGRVHVSSTAPSLLIGEIGTIRRAAGRAPRIETKPQTDPQGAVR